MKRKTLRLFMALAVMGVGSVPPVANGSERAAQIDIRVTDRTNANIFEAEVRVRPQGGTLPKNPETGKYGVFSLNLRPGTYDLFVTCPTFKSWSGKIEVHEGKNPEITVVLEVEVVPAIVHTGNHFLIDNNSPARVPEPPTREPVSFAVTDQSGSAVAYAQVWGVEKDEGGGTKVLNTDENGKLTLKLVPGNYDFVVTSPGFARWKKRVEVRHGAQQSVAVVLTEMSVAKSQ